MNRRNQKVFLHPGEEIVQSCTMSFCDGVWIQSYLGKQPLRRCSKCGYFDLYKTDGEEFEQRRCELPEYRQRREWEGW